MPFTLPIWLTPHISGLVFAFAILKGRREERVVAIVETLLLAISIFDVRTYGHALVRDTVFNLIELTVVLVLTFRSDRAWLLVACSIALASTATTFGDMVAPVSPWAYGTARLTWDYLFAIALFAGTWSSWRAGRPQSDEASLDFIPAS